MKEIQELVNEKEVAILELKAILFSTDYKVMKAYETGVHISDELKEIRANARAEINKLEGEIDELIYKEPVYEDTLINSELI